MTGTALEWIKLYLTNRNQCVIINDPEGQTKVTSSLVTLTFGIPQEMSWIQFCSPYTLPHWEKLQETSSGIPILC